MSLKDQLIHSTLALLFGAVAACGGSGTEPAAAPPAAPEPPPAPAPAAEPAPEPVAEEPAEPERKPAKEVITGDDAIFMFSFEDSGPYEKASADCEKKAKGDDEKKEECLGDIAETAATEGIRFEKDDDGAWWWVSFGEQKGKEIVYNKVKFSISAEEATKVTLKPEGKDMGKRPMKKLPPEVVIEVVDDSTVVMTDPNKGKLVYKKQ